MSRFLRLTSTVILGSSFALAQLPVVGNCSIFPSGNVWNTPIDTLPVSPNSDAYVQTIGVTRPVHPDFGSAANNGIPYNVVNTTSGAVSVTFTYADQSDPGPYPIPANPLIEGPSDSHLLIIDTANCTDYEIYQAQKNSDGSWSGGSGAIFPLTSNQLRPAGWTSADAAGLPIFPGLVRYDEVAAGVINHALRFTAPATANSYVWPARHEASSNSGTQYPPMGTRFRLKASFDVSPYPAPVQVILNAMKRYGIMLADNGSPWFISGVPDSRWDDDVMHALTNVTGASLEVVDESSLMTNPDSAQATLPGSAGFVANQWVSLVNLNSGKCLESPSSVVAAQLQQWDCNASPAQLFLFAPVNGGYKVTVQSISLQLDVYGGPASVTNGKPIIQYPYWGGSNEIWTVTPAATAGFYNIHPLNDGKCMDVHGASTSDGAVVLQWDCYGGANQAWQFKQ